MPKVVPSTLPLSGLFAIAKPSGPPSMTVINEIKHLIGNSKLFVEAGKLKEAQDNRKNKGKGGRGRSAREAVKIGQGGTLDPLADGVLVVGVGKGTKKLGDFLDCVKEYRTTCLLGCETDTYDSEGAQVRLAPWRHVTREKVESMLDKFRGDIEQTPPIFSALKMDGKPLYEYARKGIPLPRPIEKRKVTIHALELIEWKGGDHSFRYPDKKFSEEEKKALEQTLQSVEKDVQIKDEPESIPEVEVIPTAFVLKMKVSGGTYVRSIVHDLGHVLDSAAHVVTLTRSQQGKFCLEPTGESEVGCVPWEVFQRANQEGDAGEVDEEGWREWEREVVDRLEIVEGKNN
ncbi:hypothetical protein JAAARDRAFT_31980 [Jaapia argillacea MUCL 33604]|uniref:tRNA pseudouridine(55) synthase n=1 Tax=Jaapia argillacea MUCL 33604 TaxID=933084 RepID=A0A067Q4B7_9AGAM|nr:hypothetical protein JAAARDRAFT_31980 [Jaapia argillacea MUCL 33604]